ncbi:uncharacterized protein LOC123535334 [Mercenaria mercenaria]|uniref:uncharacterized protein LOC123535334 n=1 Tax=Mercenaria mercenaria TaxID=6596 RepID=UPI00234F2403|nr:uncharacterized protein LOC123535334 [Mercenaria mercenaria]
MSLIQIADLGGATINAVDAGAFITPYVMKPATETKRIFENVPNFMFRKDDVMLCTYPKTGTNWLFEIIMMILNKSAEPIETNKGMTMLEFQAPEDIDQQPSPRVVNCHFPCRILPFKDMTAKQIKTVLCCRNPKDTAVSYYNHMKGLRPYDYNGKWDDWLPVYLQGKLEYGKYTDYLLEWEKAMEEGVGFPLHVMYYEDLKINGTGEMDKLRKFLDVELDDVLKEDIVKMCGFARMATKTVPGSFTKEGFNFFRKGQIGDWKNWFTVAQDEMFDEIWKSEMKDSKMSKFIYTFRGHYCRLKPHFVREKAIQLAYRRMTSVKIKDLSGATIDEIDVGGFLIPDFKKPPAEAKQLFDSIPHFEFRDDDLIYLPLNDMKVKQIKTVLCCRNQKDTAVSYYNHMKGIEVYGYDGKWSDWLPVYLQGKCFTLCFENQNGLEEIDRLLKFLDVDLSEELKKDIIHMCGFENMANKTMPSDMEKVFFKQDFKFFRKGRVGDWKNWFTVAQNENFDEIWENEMNGSTFSQFKYSDPRDGNDVSQPSF